MLSSEQHAVFLQNMLKSTAQFGISAPASRTLSSATAQGYLPQYRGFAAASLVPAMLNISNYERDGRHKSPKTEQQSHSLDGIIPVTTPSVLSENSPLNCGRSPQPAQPMSNSLDAEGYLRYLTQKAEDKRITEQRWDVNTTGIRPVIGPDW